jgi:hypothetical protein
LASSVQMYVKFANAGYTKIYKENPNAVKMVYKSSHFS